MYFDFFPTCFSFDVVAIGTSSGASSTSTLITTPSCKYCVDSRQISTKILNSRCDGLIGKLNLCGGG